jgi:DNA-binding CsgD family transcriptional regulator
MKREIFIIHPSPIVRKGLNAILRGFFNHDITMLPDASEMKAYREIRNSLVIVFIGPDQDREHVTRLRTRNRLHLVQITGSAGEGSMNGDKEPSLSIHAQDHQVRELVHMLLEMNPAAVADQPPDDELTVREKEVLALVAMGHSNKEIAEKLFISIHTVISHRKNITEKLGIKSISGLTVYAILNRVIDPDNLNADLLI